MSENDVWTGNMRSCMEFVIRKVRGGMLRGVYAVLFVLLFAVTVYLLSGETMEYDGSCMGLCLENGLDEEACREEVCVN